MTRLISGVTPSRAVRDAYRSREERVLRMAHKHKPYPAWAEEAARVLLGDGMAPRRVARLVRRGQGDAQLQAELAAAALRRPTEPSDGSMIVLALRAFAWFHGVNAAPAPAKEASP